jgi:hypothetical protein
MSYEELQGLSPGDKTLVTSTVDCATDVHVGFSQVNDYCAGLLTQAAVKDLRDRGGWFNNFLAWHSEHSDLITVTVAIGGLAGGLRLAGKANAAAAAKPRPASDGSWFPKRVLPRDQNGVPIPDSAYPHTQLGSQTGRTGAYPQAREFGYDGQPVRDIDFTTHGRPGSHTNPHQHPWLPNGTGGTPQRGPAESIG